MKQYFVSNDGTALFQFEEHALDFHDAMPEQSFVCPTPFGKHLCGLEVLEGVDFRLQHQWLSTAQTSFKQWKDCTIEQYDSEKYPEERRIIAVPTPVTEKKERKFAHIGMDNPMETQEELWEEVLGIYDNTADYDGLNKSQAIQKFLSQFTVTRK